MSIDHLVCVLQTTIMIKPEYGKAIIFFLLLTVVLSACGQVATSQKFTINGTSTNTPFHQKSTFTPTKEPPPTHTATDTATITQTFTLTSTITETFELTQTATLEKSAPTLTTAPKTSTPKAQNQPNSEKPTIKVSITTNCRTGPGISYSKLTPLQAGKSASLIGRDFNYSYWIIKDPGNSGRDCWLWGYYASASGNTKDLKVYSNPAQDTPKSTSTAAPTAQKTTPAASKTPKPTQTPEPTLAPKTPLPTNTPNLTPATHTNTPLPATDTPIPSETPIPTDTPIPSDTPLPSNTPESLFCSYTSPLPSEEQQILDLINNARTSRGLSPLYGSDRLVYAARDHGTDMTCHGTYSHNSTDGTRAWERIGLVMNGSKTWCYSHCCCGEIFYGGSANLTPAHAFNWWMNHESQDPNYEDNIHKRTILGQYYNRIGVGVTYYQHNGVTRKFYTVDFFRR